jgi:hypothetical protein
LSKKALGGAQFAGKVKTQTFKQLQLERLIKDGTVTPASKLAEKLKNMDITLYSTQHAHQNRLNLVKLWSNNSEIWSKLVYKLNLVGVICF